MDYDYSTQYIRTQLSRIQYDNNSATSNTQYHVGLLIGVIAQQAAQDNKIMDLVQAKLEQNPYRVWRRGGGADTVFVQKGPTECQPIFGGGSADFWRHQTNLQFRTVRPASTSTPSIALRIYVQSTCFLIMLIV